MAYIKYWLQAVNEHSLHSPFLYRFYQEIIKNPTDIEINTFEGLRTKLLNDQRIIEIDDLGAGSRINKSNRREVRQIVKNASTPIKFSKLLYRLIQEFEPKTTIELGTSLGINSLYMGLAKQDNMIYTFEGSEVIAELAQENFNNCKAQNINIIKGNIDATLPKFLSQQKIIDLAYVDANHRYLPTINYFNQIMEHTNEKSIVIIDDIHWSKEMSQAWHEVKKNTKITLSIDLFEAGILFFNPELPKSNLIVKY